LREAAAAATAKKKPVPEDEEEEQEDANLGKEQTTTTSTTSATTTTTSTPAPLPPQYDDELNATKCNTKENNDDGLNKKETTTTTTTSSSTTPTSFSSPPPLHRQADTCCVCLEDLPVDCAAFSRMSCCGKSIHRHCKDNFFGSSLSREQKSKCPHCQVKLPSTTEEVELTRGWADKGKAWAQANVGNHYRFGAGVEQSYETAIEYYTKAIQQRESNAMFFLAVMYYYGDGVTKSFKKAIELLTQAANQGHANAQFNLGVLYYNGEGVHQSYELAREWWIKAAVQDDEQALQNLQQLDKNEGRTSPTILCCSTCGKPKTPLRPLYPCKLCHTVQYCGRECQVHHWKEGGHRRECKILREAAADAKKKQKQVE
jgi:TPR repeat protein